MTKKVGVLIDPYLGLMECRYCGKRWIVSIGSRGKYYRGSWQCPEGCKPETADSTNTTGSRVGAEQDND